jgi:hypothetical protein
LEKRESRGRRNVFTGRRDIVLRIAALWDVTPNTMLVKYERFGEI